ncbi:MAG TPA: Ig-like domain-containing protein [Intrasporangium sp.]|nr:Ig-like domain-containing protein [Intrasporangium sp.]
MGGGLGATAGAAHAATGTLIAGQLTLPTGSVWMGTHAWVADHTNGLCRIDGTAVNQTVCAVGPTSPGQPAFDASRNLLYVPDNSTKNTGMWRFPFDPATQRVGAGTSFNVSPDLANDTKPTATALGADGSLYAGFTRGADIVRVTNPTTASQAAPASIAVVGVTTDGAGTVGLAMAGADLYVAETAAVTTVPNVAAATGAMALPTTMQIGAPTAIAAADPDTLFVADTQTSGSAVMRYTISTDTQDVYASSTTTGVLFGAVSGLGFNADKTVLHVGDDPTSGVQVARGHLYGVSLDQPPQTAGAPGAPATFPVAPVGTPGTLITTGATAPGGSVLLGTHLWVSDHLLGFCRVDADPTTPEGFSINQDTCVADATGASIIGSPGQPAYDKASNTVYVPDNSRASQGVWRLTFDPAMDGGAGNFPATGRSVLAPAAGLGAKLPTSVALGPDGKLYVGYLRLGPIERITTPLGANQTVESVSATSDGRGLSGLGFAGGNLYVAEGAAVSVISGAPGCTGACVAAGTLVGATGPTALTANNADAVYVADTPASSTSVIEFIPSTGAKRIISNHGLTAAGPQGFQFGSALSLDEAGNLYVSDDPGAGVGAGINFQGRVWKVTGAAPLVPQTGPPATPGAPDLAATSDSGSSSTDNITKVTTPTITGTADAGTTVKLFVDGATTAAVSGPASSTGTYSLVLPALTPGTHTIQASASNAGGVSSPLSAGLSVTVDTTAPAAPAITGAPTSTTSDTTPTFSFTAEAGSTTDCSVQLSTAADSFAACVSPATFGPLADGTYRFAVRATDVAGNVGAPATNAFTVNSDVTPPTVTGRSPAVGGTAASTTGNVTATFSENVTGVSGTTFTLKDAAGAAVAAAVSYNATTRVATLDPTAALAVDARYTATLTSGIKDAAGNPLALTTWTFTTGPAPTVTSRTPAVAGTGVAVSANVTATFSENVTGVSGTTFTLKNAAGATLGALVTYNATTRVATLDPTANLAADTKYTATLTSGIKDAAGNPLVLTTWTFTTGPSPTVTSRSPGVNAVGVNRLANVTATFSENVVGVSGTTFTLKNAATGALVSAVVSYSSTTRVATLNPGVTLAANTKYTATLTTGIKDAAGNPIALTVWSFTTGA